MQCVEIAIAKRIQESGPSSHRLIGMMKFSRKRQHFQRILPALRIWVPPNFCLQDRTGNPGGFACLEVQKE